MRIPLLCLALTACSFDPSGVELGAGDDAMRVDALIPPDGVRFDDATNPCTAWAAENVDPCDAALAAPVALMLDATAHTYDTDTGELDGTSTPPHATLAQTGGPDVTALNLTTFTLAAGGSLAVSGARPLVLIVHGNAVIDGDIDVTAGGNDAAVCGMGTGKPGGPSTGDGGGGGGGGGGYGDDGGNGGDGNGGGHGMHGNKGNKAGMPAITPLRGGCAGGAGGGISDGTIDSGGAGGRGGGAFEITSIGVVNLTGTIAAGGTGGSAVQLVRGGGGGGGSGGAILIDAESASVTATAKLCANGGGGGEGGQLAGASDDGDAALCSEDTAAAGGDLDPEGGNGGAGGVEGATAGGPTGPAAASAGGGGGGAGVGRIRVRGRSVRTVDPAAVLSPAPAS